MSFIDDLKVELKRYKKGLLVGMLFGLGVALYLKMKGVSLMFAVEQQGLLDKVVTTMAPMDLAFLKVALVCIVIGGLIGYIIDRLI